LQVIVELEKDITQLQTSVENLKHDASNVNMTELLSGLIKPATTMASDLFNSYVNETIGQIDGYVNRVVTHTNNLVGRCAPLSSSYNATVKAFCNQIIDPLNGFWASIGWCYLFYLPSVALAIALVSLYRKSEPYPGPLVDVQPEDVGPTMASVAAKKRKRRGNRTNASEYLPVASYR
jgi:hypothetical protein